MKRIKYACLEQTIHFTLKDDMPREDALRLSKEELEHYKAQLAHSRVKYKIVEETGQIDGSTLLKIKKQYNGYNVGGYLD